MASFKQPASFTAVLFITTKVAMASSITELPLESCCDPCPCTVKVRHVFQRFRWLVFSNFSYMNIKQKLGPTNPHW